MSEGPRRLTLAERNERIRLQRIEGTKALEDYVNEAARVEQNTARLRALRLAKEKVESAAQNEADVKKPAKKPVNQKPPSKKSTKTTARSE